MFRILLGVLGLAVMGALFAGIYYLPDQEVVERRPAFSLQAGEVRPDFIEPSVPGGLVTVNMTVRGGAIDLWVMDQEWLASTIDRDGGGFNLSKPFSYHAQWSRLDISGQHDFEFTADGSTRYALVLDHSDTFYDDTVPEAEADAVQVEIRTRYLEEESKSLVLGYVAVVPSVLLVLLTFGRQWQRWRTTRQRRKTG